MTVKLKINGREHEAPDGQLIIEACRDAGVDIPRYCYHPGLPVVGSCRMCLVQIEGQNKLIPSCQTTVSKDINVLTHSPKVQANQRAVMEYLLINHPLDCPVCDQAGECYLQDYSVNFGHPVSRFAEEKIKQPKKDVGKHVLLYMDRCVLCSRCVRFTREISGGGELSVVGRGAHCEIDIFPGKPLDNKLSGNVVDLCPVGALLDKHFLHRQRVWLLSAEPSVCTRCSAGCNISVFHNQGRIWRLKPRENRQVNGWWMCDDGRFGWEYVHADERLDHPPRARRGDHWEDLALPDAAEVINFRLAESARNGGPGALAAVLSPMWTSEEQFMLARAVRAADPQAVLVPGPAPTAGADEVFKSGFTIRAEKAPNRRGAERVLAAMGGPQKTFDDLLADVSAGKVKSLFLGTGYPPDIQWLTDAQTKALGTAGLTLIAERMFEHPALAGASIVLAGASWAETAGTYVNVQDLVQETSAAPVGPEFARPVGDLLWLMLGQAGPPDLPQLWRLMAEAGVAGYPPGHCPADSADGRASQP